MIRIRHTEPSLPQINVLPRAKIDESMHPNLWLNLRITIVITYVGCVTCFVLLFFLLSLVYYFY